jgi:hypothetical protein
MKRTIGRLGAVLAAAAVATVAFASTAYADDRLLDRDFVKISSSGFDLGNGPWETSDWDDSATVKFLVDENDVTALVEGKLALHAVNGESARVRVDYYSSATLFLITRCGAPCARRTTA